MKYSISTRRSVKPEDGCAPEYVADIQPPIPPEQLASVVTALGASGLVGECYDAGNDYGDAICPMPEKDKASSIRFMVAEREPGTVTTAENDSYYTFGEVGNFIAARLGTLELQNAPDFRVPAQ